MKRNFLALFAVVAAIAFTAFTTEKKEVDKSLFLTEYYELNDGATNQKAFPSSYTKRVVNPTAQCPETQVLCWIKIDDTRNELNQAIPDGLITDEDFEVAFEAIDGDAGGSDDNTLDDETENHSSFEKREE